MHKTSRFFIASIELPFLARCHNSSVVKKIHQFFANPKVMGSNPRKGRPFFGHFSTVSNCLLYYISIFHFSMFIMANRGKVGRSWRKYVKKWIPGKNLHSYVLFEQFSPSIWKSFFVRLDIHKNGTCFTSKAHFSCD